MKKTFAPLAAVALALIGTAAQAAVDVTSVVSEITDAGAPVALIGTAVLVLFVGIKAFKWVRAALS